MFSSHSTRFLFPTLTMTMLLPGFAVAANDDALEEVVVSARQRSEKLLDVPISIQAFTAADIESAGITRPVDFIALTPGVSSVYTGEVASLQVSIRGINSGRDAEPNFALVVDGVLQTNPSALNQELANVEQIEVLKGPQGAVYGRNAVAGAIIITTKKPGDALQAEAALTMGNRSSQRANTWLAMPFSATVSGGVEAYYTKTDGLFDNTFKRCSDCVDYYKEYGIAPRLIFKLGDNGELDVKGKYSKVESGAINFNAAFEIPSLVTAFSDPKFFENVNDHQFKYINNIRPENEQENKQLSIKGDWQVGSGTLTAWLAFNDQTNYFLTDGSSSGFNLYLATSYCQADLAARVGGPLPAPTFYGPAFSILPPFSPSRCDGYQYQVRNQKDTSFELRMTSPSDQPLRWLGGVYYADIKRHVIVAQGSDQGRGFALQALVPASGPNPTDQLYDDDFTSKVTAVFGQLAYDVLANLEAALALRYDSEKRTVSNNVPRISPQTVGFGALGTPACPALPAPCTSYINPYYNVAANTGATSIPGRSKTFGQFQPKFSLNWKVSDEWSAFASYGIGFRSGGFNSSGSAATVQQAFGTFRYVTPAGVTTNIPGLSDVQDQYRKEVSKAAEIGVKAELLDRRLLFSAAYFNTRVDDTQFFNFFAGTFGLLRVVTNIDEVSMQGFELDARWKASRNLTLFAGYSSDDSEIKKYNGRPYTVGNKVPYAPDFTAVAGADLNIPFGGSGVSLIAHVDANLIGKTWFSAVQNNSVDTAFLAVGNFSKTARDPVTVINARLGLKGERWSATAWARNLADENYLAEVITAPEFGGAFIHEAPTRSVGLDLSYRFAGK